MKQIVDLLSPLFKIEIEGLQIYCFKNNNLVLCVDLNDDNRVVFYVNNLAKIFYKIDPAKIEVKSSTIYFTPELFYLT
jgi:hypothetical protein